MSSLLVRLKKRKATSTSKGEKGKNQVKETPTIKNGNDKGMCFYCDMKAHWKRNCKKVSEQESLVEA